MGAAGGGGFDVEVDGTDDGGGVGGTVLVIGPRPAQPVTATVAMKKVASQGKRKFVSKIARWC